MDCFPSIYKIINKINGKYYVGSTSRPSKRWYDHKYALNQGKHRNDYLQNSWIKYGASSFIFVIIASFSPTLSSIDLLKEEQKWLDVALKDPLSYNLTFVAGSPMANMSDYAKKKRSESLKKVIKTKEWKEKISKAHIGLRPNIATRIKMSKSQIGKKQTKQHKENATNGRRKNWEFMSPDGNIIKIYDLKRFCREHKLHSGNMYWVASGKKAQYKGWMKP